MSELCLSATSKAQFFFIHLISDFYRFFSFIISHPLYFSYFIFFSPYFLKLLSFLSPLFFTTSLLLLSLVANFIPHDPNSCWDWEFLSQKKMGFLTTAFYAILDRFRSKASDNHITYDQEYLCFEDSEVFKIVFDIPPVIAIANEVEEEIFFQAASEFSSSTHENFTLEETKLGCFLKESDECGSGFSCSSPEKQKINEHPISTNPKKVAELSLIRNGSEAESNKVIQQNKVEENDKTTKSVLSVSTGKCDAESSDQKKSQQKKSSQQILHSNPQKVQLVPSIKQCCCNSDYNGEMKVESSRTLDYNLGTYGSMRKEKEWKRTLACKLFEERHNVVNGGEGMDLLWETYESESSKNIKTKSRKMSKNKKKSYQEIKEDIDDEEEDESNGQLCCLQAFKFSTGKMNLGMGKPNLVKITKAIKGFGWLHQVSSRRSKKVHNGD